MTLHNNSLEATWDHSGAGQVCAAICNRWSNFAILEWETRGKPRRLSTRLRLGMLREARGR
jgi:hypothetical protein